MRPRLGSRNWTFTDVACRLKTSCSASGPRDLVVVLASAGRTWGHLEFCGRSAAPPRSTWDRCDDLAAALGECAVAGILQARGVL